METSGGNSDLYRSSSGNSNSRRYGMQFSASNFIQAPLSALLEYSGILRSRSSHQENEGLIDGQNRVDESISGEVSIRIIGAGDQESIRTGAVGLPVGQVRDVDSRQNVVLAEQISGATVVGTDRQADGRSGDGGPSSSSISPASSPSGGSDGETGNAAGGNTNNRDSSYQRYDIQQVAKWIEQILPFSLLLLVVFIRQHLQGFFVTIWIAAVMFKSNDVLRKQTALKGERKISVLVGITLVFMVHVIGVYWWFRNDDLLYPLIMLPPKTIPPFWHAVFIIMVNAGTVEVISLIIEKVKCGSFVQDLGDLIGDALSPCKHALP